MPATLARDVAFLAFERPTLVLGSTQPAADVDEAACAARRVEVARRASGGGAVLHEPGRLLWVDVAVPAGDPLWDDDVGRAFLWLGRAWQAALAATGVTGAVVHDGPLVASEWSRRVCFAGLGPGEVTVGGRKVVGMSQRRGRAGAVFQCAALLSWDPGRLLDLLRLDQDQRRRARSFLDGAAAGLEVPAPELEAALLAHLP